MQNKPHCMDLCQQASVEQDPEKLIELITEINHLLDERKNGSDRRTASRKTPLNAGGSYCCTKESQVSHDCSEAAGTSFRSQELSGWSTTRHRAPNQRQSTFTTLPAEALSAYSVCHSSEPQAEVSLFLRMGDGFSIHRPMTRKTTSCWLRAFGKDNVLRNSNFRFRSNYGYRVTDEPITSGLSPGLLSATQK